MKLSREKFHKSPLKGFSFVRQCLNKNEGVRGVKGVSLF